MRGWLLLRGVRRIALYVCVVWFVAWMVERVRNVTLGGGGLSIWWRFDVMYAHYTNLTIRCARDYLR